MSAPRLRRPPLRVLSSFPAHRDTGPHSSTDHRIRPRSSRSRDQPGRARRREHTGFRVLSRLRSRRNARPPTPTRWRTRFRNSLRTSVTPNAPRTVTADRTMEVAASTTARLRRSDSTERPSSLVGRDVIRCHVRPRLWRRHGRAASRGKDTITKYSGSLPPRTGPVVSPRGLTRRGRDHVPVAWLAGPDTGWDSRRRRRGHSPRTSCRRGRPLSVSGNSSRGPTSTASAGTPRRQLFEPTSGRSLEPPSAGWLLVLPRTWRCVRLPERGEISVPDRTNTEASSRKHGRRDHRRRSHRRDSGTLPTKHRRPISN